ncbi:MAG: hypothetical protein LIP04_08520 [Tannerellaceae bacterium]|nr:hypothetical protein [Tannerellaceae bacterium]
MLENSSLKNAEEKIRSLYATKKSEWIIQNMYGMLRTAKFLKGLEEDHE